MIEIQNIKSTDVDDVVNLLLDENKQPFEIHVPKQTVLFSSTNEDIANDYARLAYVGYRLSRISTKLKCDFVKPSEHKSVEFKITTKNFKILAETILELSFLFSNEEEEEYDYWEDVYQFITDIKNHKITTECKKLVEIYNEFISRE